jgi:hypothetical protein
VAPSGGFSVQVEDFAAVAPTFTAAGDELSGSAKTEGSVIDGAGSFWGTTAHGPEFGEKYQPLVAKVLALATMAGLAIEGVGDGLTEMGKQYGVTEAQITAALKSGI